MSSKSKRPCEEVFANCKTLIFDVEGTTTSISFVKDTLFPYVRSNLETYVKKQWSSDEFQTDLTLLREQAVKDVADKVEGCVPIPDEGSDSELQAAVIANVLWQMDCDRKTKALKQLQGHVMREGYDEGTLKGHVYSDVAPAMRAWVEKGLKLYIYSSGSVEAQKLLFGHSEQGNMLEMFQGHFDTEVGSKQDVASYTSISKQVACSPTEVVFFTDIPGEAMAAEGAGMTAILVVREGNAPLSEDDQALYQVIDSFDGFLHESPLKRRKVSDDAEVPSADVEMTDVSDASTPVSPSTLDKPVEKEASTIQPTNNVETDIEKKVEANTDILMTEASTIQPTNNVETDIEKKVEANTDILMTVETAECIPPAVDEPQAQTCPEQKESLAKDIESSACNDLEMAKTENSNPEGEDKTKEITEAEHMCKDQSISDKLETENNVKLLTPMENGDPIELSTTAVKVPTETKSEELESAAQNTCNDGLKVEEPQSVLSKVEAQETSLEEKAVVDKSVIEEDKVTKMVMDAVDVTSKANDSEKLNKGEADAEKVVLTEVKEIVEEKKAPSPLKETNGTLENMKESIPEPIDPVMSKDTEGIDKGATVELGNELEPNSGTDKSDSMLKDSVSVTDKVDTLEKIEIADTKVEGEKDLQKTDLSETNVGSNASQKIDTKMECDLSEKVDNVNSKVEEVAKIVDTIDDTVSEKEMHSTDTKGETDGSEKSDLVDTKNGTNNQEEADKVNSAVEMGQGDAGTLVELSKNVESGKVEEIKVKKVLADNASDDTENAVPVTMET